MKFYKRFPGDIQIKTGHLTPAEFGCYDRLLDHYYATERALPPELHRCASIARAITTDDLAAMERVLAEFFELTPAGWVQQRTEEMIADALPRIEAARENGKLGGRPKKNPAEPIKKPTGFSGETQTGTESKTQSADLAKASQSQIPEESFSSKKTPPTPRKRGASFDPKTIELPDWIDRALWQRWCADRAKRRHPITEEGAKGQIARLAKLRTDGFPASAVIEHAMASGHQGLYPPPKDMVEQAQLAEQPWHATGAGIKSKGAELGLTWREDGWIDGEHMSFPVYTAKVFKAAGHSPRAAA